MLSFMLFGRAAVRKMRGHARWELPTRRARLREGVSRKDGRRHYLRVRLQQAGDGWEATLTGDQGSGILLSMVAADGVAVIPEDSSQLPAGSEVEVILFPSSQEGA